MWTDDTILNDSSKSITCKVWVPEDIYVVLGNANKVETECYSQNCLNDKVSLLKRYGGGGTVVLHSGCIILSLGMWVKDYFKNDLYFSLLNKSVISTLSEINSGFKSFSQKGISDICYGDKKNIGTSLFRSRNYLLYQASIIFDPKLKLIERYLKHPSKEPAYRKNKDHKDFLIGIKEIFPSLKQEYIKRYLDNHFIRHVQKYMKDEMILCEPSQISNLLKRACSDRGKISYKNNIELTKDIKSRNCDR